MRSVDDDDDDAQKNALTLRVLQDEKYIAPPTELVLGKYASAFPSLLQGNTSLSELLFESVSLSSVGVNKELLTHNNGGINFFRSTPVARGVVTQPHTGQEPAKGLLTRTSLDIVSSAVVIPENNATTKSHVKVILGHCGGLVTVLSWNTLSTFIKEAGITEEKVFNFDWGFSVPQGIEVLGSHENGKVICCEYDNERDVVLTAGADASLYVWDVKNKYNVLPSFPARPSSEAEAFAIQVKKNRLGCCVKNAHGGSILKLVVQKNYVFSGGTDNVLKIWRVEKAAFSFFEYIPCQQVELSDWVHSITVLSAENALTEQVFAADCSGYMVSLARKNKLLTSSEATKAAGSNHAQAPFQVARSKHFSAANAQTYSRNELTRREKYTKGSQRFFPIAKCTAFLSISYGAVARLYEYSSFQLICEIPHPLLSAENIARDKGEKDKGRSFFSPDSLATGLSKLDPLRFLDALYISGEDLIVLLDNRNHVYLYDKTRGNYLSDTAMRGSSKASALQLGESASSDELAVFYALYDTHVERYTVVRQEEATVKMCARFEWGVAGVSAWDLSHSQLVDGAQGAHGLVAVDEKGNLRSWDNKWKPIHNCQKRLTDDEEITSFLLCSEWDMVITGHNNGSLVYWPLDNLDIQCVTRHKVHDNAVSALLRVSLTTDLQEVLATIGFDGVLALWQNSPKSEAHSISKTRVSWSELTCVVYNPYRKTFVVGDTNGTVFTLCWNSSKPYVLFKFSSTNSSSALPEAITSLCLFDDRIVAGTDEGYVLMKNGYKTGEVQKLHLSHVSRAKMCDINCAVPVFEDRVLLGCRNGALFLASVVDLSEPLLWYRLSTEVHVVFARGDSFSTLQIFAGCTDGTLTTLSLSCFSPLW